MKILFIGDIFSSVGRHIVADHLADIKQTQQIDLAIANAENSAGGFGITPTTSIDGRNDSGMRSSTGTRVVTALYATMKTPIRISRSLGLAPEHGSVV